MNDNLGAKGEDIACEYLVNNHFEIIERNWRFGHKEIDIIAQKGKVLYVVEVKTRTGKPLVEGRWAVNKQKQKDLITAANAFVTQKNIEFDVQFDIIEVIYYAQKFYVRYIPEAFYPRL